MLVSHRSHFPLHYLVGSDDMIEENPCAGMDFRRDPDLILLVGTQWGAIGKMFDHVFDILAFFTYFCV